MDYKTTIYIIKTQTNKRQVKFRNLVIGEYETKEESIEFSKGYLYGDKIEIWEGENLLDEIIK